MSWLQVFAVIAGFLVAIGTGALALATFRMLRKADEWNRRNEEMRVLPLLRLELIDVSVKMLDPPFEEWVKSFIVTVTNVGTGPTVSQRFRATQDKNAFSAKLVKCPRHSGLQSPSWFVGVGEKICVQFEIEGTPVEQNMKSESPPVKINAFVCDIFGRVIKINYDWDLLTSQINVSIVEIAGRDRLTQL